MYLSAGISGMCLWKSQQRKSDNRKAGCAGGRRTEDKFKVKKREASDF